MSLRLRAEEKIVRPSFARLALAGILVIVGVAFAAAGIYVGDTDDAPGAALLGFLLMIGSLVLAVRTVRRKA